MTKLNKAKEKWPSTNGLDAEEAGFFGASGSSPGPTLKHSRRVPRCFVRADAEPSSVSPSTPRNKAAEANQSGDLESLQLLTRLEAARILRASVSAVRKWQREGLLPTVKLGTSVRIPASSLQQFILANTSPSRAA